MAVRLQVKVRGRGLGLGLGCTPNHHTIVSFDRRTLLRLLFHVPALVSAIGHFQLLDHVASCRPTYDSLTLTKTPRPSDLLSVVCHTNVLYLLNYSEQKQNC